MRRITSVVVVALLASSVAFADTPTVMYLMNQASSGTGPTSLTDTAPGTAVPATCGYGTGSWASITAGDGRTYAGNGDQTGALNGTKVATQLAGATHATWEVVVDTTGDPAGSPIAMFGGTGSNNLFTLTTVSAASNGGQSAVAIDWDDAGSNVGLCSMNTGLHSLIVAIDTTQATGTNRSACYVDGTATALTGATAPAQNTAIDAGFTNYANNRVAIGSFLGFQTSPAVKVYFAALYPTTMSSGTAAAHSTSLLANNDTDPNAGGGAPTYDSLFFVADNTSAVWWP